MGKRISYLKSSKVIIFHDTLKKVRLNKTSELIFNDFMNNIKTDDIARNLKNKYPKIELKQIKTDVKSTLTFFHKLGITNKNEINKQENVNYSTWTPTIPIIHINQNCNSPCKFCDCWKFKKSYHKLEKLNPIFKILKSKGANSIMVSGGEPLLHPELKDILENIKAHSLKRMLNTNGILLNKHKYLHDLDIEQLVISMDGTNKEDYRYYRGIDAFDRVWENICEFKHNSPKTKIHLRLIVNRFNLSKIEEYFKLCEENSLDGLGFSPADIGSSSFSREDMDNNRSENLKDILLPTYEEIDHHLSTLIPGTNLYNKLQKAKESGFSTWNAIDLIRCLYFYKSVHEGKNIFDNKLCKFPQNSLVLDYNGDLKNCFYSKSFGNLYNEKIHWNFKDSINDLITNNKCINCRGKVFCN